MASQFYGYTEPQCISGPRITPSQGPAWDRAEATFLCTGDRAAAGGFVRGTPFPGAPGFYLDGDPETEATANNAYLVRINGRGCAEPRVYSQRISYTASEVQANLEVGGVPFSTFQSAWPQVDLLLNQEGFRQIIVGATTILGDVGQRVAAPQDGAFPPAPPNPWTEIDSPRLNYPWGWILARRDAEPLIDGPYSAAGPWILTNDYVYRWKVVPG